VKTLSDFEHYSFQDNGRAPTNILDEYSGYTTSEVRGIRDETVSGLVNVAMNLTGDFNKASILRAHCAFSGSELFLVGKRRFDKRGTVGTHHYIDVYHSETCEPVIEHLKSQGYTLFAVDNTPKFNPSPVYEVDLPVKSAFFYGEEQAGLSDEIVEMCDHAVYIPQPSPVPRSINVAQAAAVMMSEYTRRHYNS